MTCRLWRILMNIALYLFQIWADWLPCQFWNSILHFVHTCRHNLFNPFPRAPGTKCMWCKKMQKAQFSSKMKDHESISFESFTPVTGLDVKFHNISTSAPAKFHLFELFLHQNPSQFSTQTLTHAASQCLAGLATHLGDLLGNEEPWKQPATLCMA